MALPCSDARQCCAAVYVAFVPQAAESLASHQVLWAAHTPTPLGTGAWLEWQQGADADLGLGRPLQADVMQQQGTEHFVAQQTPVQCFMGCPDGAQAVWHAPAQFIMGAAECPPSDASCSGPGVLSFGGQALAMQSGAVSAAEVAVGSFAPDQEHMGVPFSESAAGAADSSPARPRDRAAVTQIGDVAGDEALSGMSSSMLRRRRRQRAAMRACGAAADEGHLVEMCVNSGHLTEAATEEDVTRVAMELIQQVQGAGDVRQGAFRLRRYAFADKASSRAAQVALAEAQGYDAAALAAGMHGHVRAAMRSMFANYVIQKIVEVMPWSSASFIPNELLGVGRDVARHRFGCRIMCRLLEHGPLNDPSLAALLEEVLADAAALSCHEFGNYVVRHSLEFGLPEHRRWVVQALCPDLADIASEQYGSRVVETALQYCGAEEQHMLATELLRDSKKLVSLATSVSGRHVVKTLLSTPGSYKQRFAEALRPAAQELRDSRYGKLVLDLVERIPM